MKNKYQLLDEKESEEGQEINQELLKIEEELETEKKNEKLTSENISKDGFSKTVSKLKLIIMCVFFFF